jgi:hypothetical protein
MDDAVTVDVHTGAVDQFNVNREAILAYLNLNPNDPKTHAVIAVCQRYDLDPVLKHVVVIPQGGVYVTRDGLLHVAHRSGQFDGMEVSEPVLNEEQTHYVCKASVWRKDMSRPFIYSGRYPKTGGNQRYAWEMATKVAESHALRRAFDVAAPTEDEAQAEIQEAKTRHVNAVLEGVVARENGVGQVEGMERHEGELAPNPIFDEFVQADAAFAEEEGAPEPDAQKLAVFLEQIKIAANYAELNETVSDAKAAAGVDAITPRGWELVRVAANLRRQELLEAMEQASEVGA